MGKKPGIQAVGGDGVTLDPVDGYAMGNCVRANSRGGRDLGPFSRAKPGPIPGANVTEQEANIPRQEEPVDVSLDGVEANAIPAASGVPGPPRFR